MTAEPIGRDAESDAVSPPEPGARPYDVIHLGRQTAVVVPMSDFLRLRALEESASTEALEDAEDAADIQDWQARETAGTTSYVPMDQVRQRLGLRQ